MSKEPGSRNGLPRRTHRVKREIGSDASIERLDKHGAEGINSGGRTEEGQRHTTASAPTAPGSKLEKRANVAGFLAKAYQIFDNPSWFDVCGWGQNGETVVIRKQIEFAQRILPMYFNHSNLQSFVRQLNMYNFRKVVQDPNSGEFKHDLFRKGNTHLLHLIKRKQSPGTAGGSGNIAVRGKQELDYGDNAGQSGDVESTRAPEKDRVAGGIMKEAEGVLEELVRLRQWQKDMENTVVELKRDNQTLQDENQMLKGQVAEHANQQLVLQNKMQKILFCMYDVYITGIRGPNAHDNSHAASRGITELADSEGNEENKSGGGIGAGKAVKNLTEGGSSSSALESGLAQLAALGGESIPGRLNLLDMENPWASGSGSGSTASGSGDGKTRSPPVSGSSGGGGSVVGGGALTRNRNRTWSQSSYDWLRSLRDPDPLGSVASHPAPASSVPAAAAATRTEAKDEGGAAPTSNDDVTVAPSKAADGDDGTSAAVAASPEMDNRPTKRQRKSESPAANNVDEVDVGEAGNDGGTFGGEDALRAPSFQPNAPISLSTSGGGLMQRAPSFQPNAPISLSTTGGGPIQRTSSFQLNGSVDEGQVWGGGDLSRTLSEGANQVVSELGELGHCEGEALSKIDSLGFQLANLLDTNEPIMGLDEVSMFGDSSEASPSLGEAAGASTGGTDSPTVPGNVTSSNTISVEDGLVSFAFSEESSAPAVRVSDAVAETSSTNMDDNNVSNSKEDPKEINGGRDVQSESGTEAVGSVEGDDQAAAAALDSVNEQPGVAVSTYRAEDDDRGNMTIVGTNGNSLPIVGSETA